MEHTSIRHFVFFLTLAFLTAASAGAATLTWSAAGAGNWSNAANWSVTSGTDADSIPDADDIVVFDSTSTVDATIDIDFTIDKLWVETDYTGTVTIASNLTLSVMSGFTWNSTTARLLYGTLRLAGNQDVDSKAFHRNITLTVDSGVTVTLLTDMNLDGGISLSGGGQIKDGGGKLILRSGTTADFSGSIDGLELAMTGSGGLTMSQDLHVNNLTVTSGRLWGPGMLKVAGDVTSNAIEIRGDGFVALVGATDQTLTGTGVLHRIHVDKSSGDVLLPSDFRLSSTAYSSYLTGSGSIRNTGGKLITGPGTLNFDFNGSIDDLELAAGNYSVNLSRDLTVNDNLTITSALELVGPGALKVSGNVTTYDTDVRGDAFVCLIGSTDQTISGTGEFDYLEISKPSGKVLMDGFNPSFLNAIVSAGEWDLLGYAVDVGNGLTIKNGASLVGVGTVDGSVTVESGGTLSIGGDSPGLMTITIDLTLESGSTFWVDVGGDTPGTQHDQVIVGNRATINTATLSGTSSASPSEVTVIDSTYGVFGSFLGAPNTGDVVQLGSQSYQVNYAGGADQKDLTLETTTINVNSTADNLIAGDTFCTLREAIMNANANADTTLGDCAAGTGDDTINIPEGTYTLTLANTLEHANADGDLDVTDADTLTLQGAGARATIVDGNAASRIFHVLQGAEAEIYDLTIQNGFGGQLECNGGGIHNSGTLKLQRVRLTANTTLGGTDAGAICNNGTLDVDQSLIDNNVAAEDGGGVEGGGTMTFSNTTFFNNTGRAGGAIRVLGGTTTLTNVTILDNHANNSGGAIHSAGTVNVQSSILVSNLGAVGFEECKGNITSLGNNVIGENGNAGGCTTITSDQVVAGTKDTVLTTALANNGGPTDTLALASGSPALDNGDATACAAAPVNNVDQRGTTRSHGTSCDVGAYEQGLPVNNVYAFQQTTGCCGPSYRMESDGSNPETLTASGVDFHDFTYDPVTGLVYAYQGYGGYGVVRMELDGSNLVQVTQSAGNANGWGLDPVNRKVYMGDRDNDKIWVGDADATYGTLSVFLSITDPADIEPVPSQGQIYFMSPAGVHRINDDGTGLVTLVADSGALNRFNGLELDLTNGKMYWTSINGPEYVVRRADLDGSNIEMLYGTSSPALQHAIAVDPLEAKLYVVDNDLGLRKFNLDGSGAETIFSSNDIRGVGALTE